MWREQVVVDTRTRSLWMNILTGEVYIKEKGVKERRIIPETKDLRVFISYPDVLFNYNFVDEGI